MSKIFRILFLFILVLTVCDKNCFAKCKKRVPSVNSDSCYCNKGKNDSGKWIIQFSQKTLNETVKQAEFAKSTLKNVNTILRINNLKSGALVFDNNKANKKEAQDCKIYGVNSKGQVDFNDIVKDGYTYDCIVDAVQFAYEITSFIDRENSIASNRSINHFNKLLVFSEQMKIKPVGFNFKPDNQITKDLSFIMANSSIMKDTWVGQSKSNVAFAQKNQINYPMVGYSIAEGDSLWSIAAKQTNNPTNWPTIWAINSENINSTSDLFPNNQIYIPAKIIGWKKVNIKGKNKDEISQLVYGSKEFKSLVEQICKMPDGKNKSERSFPMYNKYDKIELVYVGNTLE